MLCRRALLALIVCCFIASPLFAITRSWNGATSANWSDPTNWSPAGTPAAVDSLIFPTGARLSMTNDLPTGTTVGPMTFNDNYTLSGNGLTLNGDLAFLRDSNDLSIASIVFYTNLKLATSVTFGSGWNSYMGTIDVNGQTLTIDETHTANSTALLDGPLNGTGTVIINGSGVWIYGIGTFSGTISGAMSVAGALPNATISGRLTGVGTVGNATLGMFSPGPESPWKTFGYDLASGTIHTKSLLLTGTNRFDLAQGGASDQVQVAGTVGVGGSLIVDILSGAPASGQTFTLIDNDGADPVSGTFNGMPEGATFAVGTSTFAISYHGGDGNDVVLTAISSQKAWTGAVSSFWSDSRNWSPQAIPAAGEVLLFPGGATRLTMTNDLPAGTTVGAMTFNDYYTLSGNALTLNGDLAFRRDVNNFANVQVTFNADFKLATAVTFGSAPNNYNGAIDVNGQTLTIDENNTINDTARLNGPLNGSGTVTISGPGVYFGGTGTFSGTINGAMNVSGSLPNATINGRLTGVGTVGNATLATFSPGNESPWKTFGYDDAAGVMHTKSLVLNGVTRFDLAPGATSDQVQVTGTVAVGGSLTLNILSGALTVGQSFVLIDNDGADPVSSTFTGMPERTTFALGGQMTRISYQRGDGNDVVLSVLAVTTSVLTQNAGDTKVGEPWTLTNAVSSAAGVPTGLVSFSADGVPLGPAAVVNGVATLTIAPATIGTRHVTAIPRHRWLP